MTTEVFPANGEAQSSHDTPEIRQQVTTLFEKATAAVLAAPDVESPDQLDNPQSSEFRVVQRTYGVGGMYGAGRGATITSGMSEAAVRGGVEIAEGVHFNEEHRRPVKGARFIVDSNIMPAMRRGEDGAISTIAQRRILVGGQPAVAQVEVNQRMQEDGELGTYSVNLDLVRTLPDGRKYRQRTKVAPPHDLRMAFLDEDTLERQPDSPFTDRDETARTAAASQLPTDPEFPADQSLGFEQCLRMLDEQQPHAE
jgi:hypothetical protein